MRPPARGFKFQSDRPKGSILVYIEHHPHVRVNGWTTLESEGFQLNNWTIAVMDVTRAAVISYLVEDNRTIAKECYGVNGAEAD